MGGFQHWTVKPSNRDNLVRSITVAKILLVAQYSMTTLVGQKVEPMAGISASIQCPKTRLWPEVLIEPDACNLRTKVKRAFNAHRENRTLASCAWFNSLRPALQPKTNRPPMIGNPHRRIRGKQYPQVNSEGRVKFRIVAPKAQGVAVSFRDSSTFAKGEDGAWTGYTRPLDEGCHYYTINIDGAEVPYPNSLFFCSAGRWGSAVEVPAKDADFYALKGVPNGFFWHELHWRFV
jgi:hypothetical protein